MKGTVVGLNNHFGTVFPLIRTWTVTSDALMLRVSWPLAGLNP